MIGRTQVSFVSLPINWHQPVVAIYFLLDYVSIHLHRVRSSSKSQAHSDLEPDQVNARYFYSFFFLQGLALIKLTSSAAFVTLVIRADTAMCLLLSVAMTLVILVFPALIKQCQLPVVRAHQVLQATGKTAKVKTVPEVWIPWEPLV